MTTDLRDGDILGDFRIVRRLGAGAMGVVYEAVEQNLRRTVALKVLPDDLSRDPKRRARFLREARAAAAVTDPAVVAIYQIGYSETDPPRDYIAMELVRGRTLRNALGDGPMPLALAVSLGRAIAQGLGSAHAAGVVHRDVKPDNVMLTTDGGVKILDFGIARLTETENDMSLSESDKSHRPPTALTAEGHLVGTPGYMSPEQSRGASIDARADVFALGAMLYEMLTGLRPFRGETPLEVIIAAARDDVPPLHGVRADVPPSLAAIVDRCLAKDAEQRFPHGRAVAEALAAVDLPAGRDARVALMLDTLDAPAPVGAPAARPLPAPPLDPLAAQAPTDPPARPPERPRGRRPAAWVAGAALLVGGGVAATIAATSRGAEAPPSVTVATRTPVEPAATTPAPTAAPDLGAADAASAPSDVAPVAVPGSVIRADDPAIVPCPIFEVAGIDAPGGWLGAAAADETCTRLTAMLGGEVARTRVPAELLALPATPLDDFPSDPYGADGARDKTLAAARALSAIMIAGKVEAVRTGFDVTLRVVRDGRVVAEAAGRGRALYQAVGGALDRLAARGDIALAAALDVDIRDYSGALDARGLVSWFDYQRAVTSGVGVEAVVDAMDQHPEGVRPEVLAVARAERDARRGGNSDQAAQAAPAASAPPAPTPSPAVADPVATFWRVAAESESASQAEALKLADQLAPLRARASDPFVVGQLIAAEGGLRLQAGDTEGMRKLALLGASHNPRLVEWRLVGWAAGGQPWARAGFAAQAAWAPDDPSSWLNVSEASRDTFATAATALERAVLLSPDTPMWALQLTVLLVRQGKPMRARELAGRFAEGGPEQVTTAETMYALVEAGEASFGKAAARATKALFARERFGGGGADLQLLWITSKTRQLIGTERDFGDAFAARFVLSTPHRLVAGPDTLRAAGEACMLASKPVAKACFAKLDALIRDGFFAGARAEWNDRLYRVFERVSRGDMKAAADEYRPLLPAGLRFGLGAEIFDALGETELARDIDVEVMKYAADVHGANMGHVREARRAFARKDWASARRLAQTVIDAWGTADVAVPFVAEMRALIAKLPK